MSHDDLRPEDERKPSPNNKYGLTDEEMLQLSKARKRNFVLAVVGGLILAVMGFFAAQNMGGDGASATLEVLNVWPL